jgi:hypothetical protein
MIFAALRRFGVQSTMFSLWSRPGPMMFIRLPFTTLAPNDVRPPSPAPFGEQALKLFKFADDTRFLPGPGTSPRISTGSPGGQLDLPGLAALIEEHPLRPGEERFYNLLSVLWHHAYVAIANVTPSEETLFANKITPKQYEYVIRQPSDFVATWLFSFPQGATIEYAGTGSGSVFRLMQGDPVLVQSIQQAVIGPDTCRLIVDGGDPLAAFTTPTEVARDGETVGMSFVARTLYEPGGYSHGVTGSVSHVRVILPGAPSQVYEVRLGFGGGTITGGLPNRVMAQQIWSRQFRTISDMLARPDYYAFSEALAQAEGVDAKLAVVKRFEDVFKTNDRALAMLNRIGTALRWVQRYSIVGTPVLGGRYVLKHQLPPDDLPRL